MSDDDLNEWTQDQIDYAKDCARRRLNERLTIECRGRYVLFRDEKKPYERSFELHRYEARRLTTLTAGETFLGSRNAALFKRRHSDAAVIIRWPSESGEKAPVRILSFDDVKILRVFLDGNERWFPGKDIRP